ncbi:hypothetical protein PSPO01_07712 [Paraphaeosphaeria sporulosa]
MSSWSCSYSSVTMYLVVFSPFQTVGRRELRYRPRLGCASTDDVSRPANALRDYQYTSQLPPLPSPFAARQRTEIESDFQLLANPHRQQMNTAAVGDVDTNFGDGNVPYNNEYLSLNRKPTQNPGPVREFSRKHLPRPLSWTEEEKSSRRAGYSRGLPPEMYSPSLNRMASF